MLTAGLLLLGFEVPLRGWALWAAAVVLLVASVVAVGRAARGRREHRA